METPDALVHAGMPYLLPCLTFAPEFSARPCLSALSGALALVANGAGVDLNYRRDLLERVIDGFRLGAAQKLLKLCDPRCSGSAPGQRVDQWCVGFALICDQSRLQHYKYITYA